MKALNGLITGCVTVYLIIFMGETHSILTVTVAWPYLLPHTDKERVSERERDEG